MTIAPSTFQLNSGSLFVFSFFLSLHVIFSSSTCESCYFWLLVPDQQVLHLHQVSTCIHHSPQDRVSFFLSFLSQQINSFTSLHSMCLLFFLFFYFFFLLTPTASSRLVSQCQVVASASASIDFPHSHVVVSTSS